MEDDAFSEMVKRQIASSKRRLKRAGQNPDRSSYSNRAEDLWNARRKKFSLPDLGSTPEHASKIEVDKKDLNCTAEQQDAVGESKQNIVDLRLAKAAQKALWRVMAIVEEEFLTDQEVEPKNLGALVQGVLNAAIGLSSEGSFPWEQDEFAPKRKKRREPEDWSKIVGRTLEELHWLVQERRHSSGKRLEWPSACSYVIEECLGDRARDERGNVKDDVQLLADKLYDRIRKLPELQKSRHRYSNDKTPYQVTDIIEILPDPEGKEKKDK